MHRRTVLVIGMSSIVGAAIVIACTFPEASFVSTTNEGGPDGTGPDGSSTDTSIDDAGELDAERRQDGESRIDADPTTCCDCDHDGYEHPGANCDAGPDGSLGDCDDFDKLIHPGPRGFVAEQWPTGQTSHTPAGDWDCDGVVEKQYPNVNLMCNGCNEGYNDDPPCGTTGVYSRCTGALNLCTNKTPIDNARLQTCR